jgi:hypothetical protein
MFILRLYDAIEVPLIQSDGSPEQLASGTAAALAEHTSISALSGHLELLRVGAVVSHRPPQNISEVTQHMADVTEVVCFVAVPAAVQWYSVISAEDVESGHVSRLTVLSDPTTPHMYSMIFTLDCKVRDKCF